MNATVTLSPRPRPCPSGVVWARFGGRLTALAAAAAIGALPMAAPVLPRLVWPAVPLLAFADGWCGEPERQVPQDSGRRPAHDSLPCPVHCARPANIDAGATPPSTAALPPPGSGAQARVPSPSSGAVPVHGPTLGARGPPLV